MMTTSPELEVGDNVFIGSGKVHWVITYISGRYSNRRLYELKSGMSGRRKTVSIGPGTTQLTLHSKGSTAWPSPTTEPTPSEPLAGASESPRSRSLRTRLIAFAHWALSSNPLDP